LKLKAVIDKLRFVATANYGWIIKKTQDSQSGSLDFTSREGAANNPELVIFFG